MEGIRKEKILLSAFAAMFVVLGINATQLNASEIKGNEAVNVEKGTRTIFNSKNGWSYGSMGICDQNNYDVFYSQNTTAGGKTYQQAWIDSDVYAKSTVTKKNATAKAQRGARYTYDVGWKDYN